MTISKEPTPTLKVQALSCPSDFDREVLFCELQAVSKESAARLRGREVMSEEDLYDEDGLPA
jgi:hypothetical protein